MPADNATPDPPKSTAPAPGPGRSTGPRTPSGKAVASLNSLAHGLRPSRPVVGEEREADYLAFLSSTAAALSPSGPIELALAERAASALWRLKHATRYEDGIIALSLERIDHNVLPRLPDRAPLARLDVSGSSEAAFAKRTPLA